MDHVVVECPQCHAQGTMDGAVVGKPATCPQCGTTFMVQAAQVKATPPPPPSPAEEPAPPLPTSDGGTTHSAPVPVAPAQPAWKKPWVIALAVLGLIIFISLCASDFNKARGGKTAGGGNTSATSGTTMAADGSAQTSAAGDAAVIPVQSGGATEPFEQFRTAAKQATYDDLARNADSLKGTKVRFTGKVIQVVSDEGGKEDLRVQMTRGEDGWENEVHVEYARGDTGPRVLEDDIIAIWGTVLGLVTFDRTVGGQATVPSVQAAYVTFPEKPLTVKLSKTVTLTPWNYTAKQIAKYSLLDERGQLTDDKASYEFAFTLTGASSTHWLAFDDLRCDILGPDGKVYKGRVSFGGRSVNGDAGFSTMTGDTVDCSASFSEVPNFAQWPTFRLYGGQPPTDSLNRLHGAHDNENFIAVDENSHADVTAGQ